MKKVVNSLILIILILCNISLTVNAQSMEHDFYKMFNIVYDITDKIQLEKKNKMMTNMFFFTVAGVIMILVIFSIILFKQFKKLKEKNHEMNNFNELRKSFINSYNNLIYLKDENLKYIFVNKAMERFYNKEEAQIIGCSNFDLADKEFAEKQRKTDLDVLKKRITIEDEISVQNRIYKMIKFPVKLINGNYGVGAYIDDVTEAYNSKKREEKNLLRNQILVGVLGRNFKSTQEQLDYVLNESLKLTESKFGYMYLYNEERQEFTLNSWSKDIMPECTIIKKLTKYQLESIDLWGEVVRQRAPIIVNDYKMPNSMKKGYPEGHVEISKFMSIPVMSDDKIVAVVGLANKESDYDYNDVYQITALMNGVWNAKERREILVKLAIEKNKLLQTLISIGEGVLVVDLEGKVTMLNKVAEKLTGWTTEEAEGRHYKEVFVLSHEDENLTINDPIEGVLITDMIQELGNHAMLTSRDGTKYYLEDSAAPIKDDKDITNGVVLVFRDVTEKKDQRKKIEYLSFHDSLTGLYNRRFFEEELRRLDKERNLPISIIVGDMNGLKLTNDIFGHAAGDMFLKKISEVLKRVCRADDIIARVGGDEFTILLPQTKEEDAKEIILRIKDQFSKESVKGIKGSISMECDAKTDVNENILETLENAENRMYSSKTLDRNSFNITAIKAIIKTLHESSAKEEIHSNNVSEICENIGRLMNLSEVEIRRVKEAGLLHDIGKIVLDESLINKNEPLTDEELKEMKQHPIVGYRILNRFDDTLDLAEYILHHHENWDGSGYPKGLKGEEIPKLARIIAVAENYDAMTNTLNKNAISKEKAIEKIKKQAGVKFDPEIVEIFIKMIKEEK